jgi:hypothetical protein
MMNNHNKSSNNCTYSNALKQKKSYKTQANLPSQQSEYRQKKAATRQVPSIPLPSLSKLPDSICIHPAKRQRLRFIPVDDPRPTVVLPPLPNVLSVSSTAALSLSYTTRLLPLFNLSRSIDSAEQSLEWEDLLPIPNPQVSVDSSTLAALSFLMFAYYVLRLRNNTKRYVPSICFTANFTQHSRLFRSIYSSDRSKRRVAFTQHESNNVTASVSTFSVADASSTTSLNLLSNTRAQAPVSCLRKAERWYSLTPLLKRFPRVNRIRVKFDTVKVREHARTVGDSSMPGPFPLGLDWKHGECTIYPSSGMYFRSREGERQLRSRAKEENILPDERFNLLLPFSESRDALLELEFRRIEQMQSEGHRHLCPDYNDLEIDPEEEQWHADQDKKRVNHQEALEFLNDKRTTNKIDKTSPPRRSKRIATCIHREKRQRFNPVVSPCSLTCTEFLEHDRLDRLGDNTTEDDDSNFPNNDYEIEVEDTSRADLPILVPESTTTKKPTTKKTSPPRRSKRIAKQLRQDLNLGSLVHPITGTRRSMRLTGLPKPNYRE